MDDEENHRLVTEAMNTLSATLIAAKIFLGEAYPSGNAYLQAFIAPGQEAKNYSDRPSLESLPKIVALHCFRPEGCKSSEVGAAPRTAKRDNFVQPELSRKLDPKAKIEVVVNEYVPAREGLDDSHLEPCQLPYKRNPRLYYGESTDGDFLSTMADNCSSDELLVRYHVEKTSKMVAYQIFGVAADLQLGDVKLYDSGKGPKARRRPPTKAEKAAVALAKKQIAKEKDECTTVPAYVDSATVLLSATVLNTDETIRISFYSDPGCEGHFGSVYLLDVMRGARVISTFTLNRALGVL